MLLVFRLVWTLYTRRLPGDDQTHRDSLRRIRRCPETCKLVRKALAIFDIDIWLDDMAGLRLPKYLENLQKILGKSQLRKESLACS